MAAKRSKISVTKKVTYGAIGFLSLVLSLGFVTSQVRVQQNTASHAALLTPTIPPLGINLSNWKLTLPIGPSENPTEIFYPQLASYTNSPWFVKDNSTTYRFRAPVNGTTTKGSDYPRSELREMKNNGATNQSWSSTVGSHSIMVTEAFTAVPAKKKHVVGLQIHDGSSDVIAIRLEYPVLYINVGGKNVHVLNYNYTLGKKFTVWFEVAKDVTAVYYNPLGGTTRGDDEYELYKSYRNAYFKAGAYTQSNCSKELSGTCSSNNYGEVVISALNVQHK